jgi:hypothetical protein
VGPRAEPRPVEDRLRGGRRAAHDVGGTNRILGAGRRHDLHVELGPQAADERLAPRGRRRVDEHAVERARCHERAKLPLGLDSSADQGQDGGVPPCKETRRDAGGGAGPHRGQRRPVDQRHRPSRGRVEPHDHRLDGGHATLRVGGDHRDELDGESAPAVADPGHEKQIAGVDRDVRPQRRPIASGGDVAVRRLDGVEHLGHGNRLADPLGRQIRRLVCAHRVIAECRRAVSVVGTALARSRGQQEEQ